MPKIGQKSGQAVIEYVILLAITVGGMLYFIRTMTGAFDQSVPKMGGTFERQLRAGAAPASLWKK